MPKKIFKIPHFNDGIVGNMSKRDIPTTAMSYGENVDSRQSGTVRGIPADTLEHASFDGRVMESILGETNEIIGQNSSGQFKSYDIDGDSVSSVGSSQSEYVKTMVPLNQEMYCGMTTTFRGDTTGTPKWVGRIEHHQFFNTASTSDLSSGITDSETSFDVDAIGDISTGDYIATDPSDDTNPLEIMKVTGVSGTTLTVDRGKSYTTASAHDSGTRVSVVLLADPSHTVEDAGLIDGSNSNDIVGVTNFGEPNAPATGSGYFTADKEYFYGFSFVYDGFQESPLITSDSSGDAFSYTPNNEASWLFFDIDLHFEDSEWSNRITGMNIYRAESDGASDSPSTLYRFVYTVPIFVDPEANYDSKVSLYNWEKTTGSPTHNFKWDNVFDYGIQGATYEDNTGVPETVGSNDVDYAINADYGQYMFVGNCSKSGIGDADKYLFRSKPKAFSMFDWTSDFVQLPERPKALAGFGGRLYAFGAANTYRINPDFMSLEDTFRGVGALNENMVVTTNYGMFHADENNIYINDGRHSAPIGTPILENEWDTIGWSDLAKTSTGDEAYASMEFDPINRRLLVFGTTSGTDLIVWSYDVERKRWDHYPTLGLVSTTAIGPNGKVFAVKGDTGNGFDLYSLFSSSTRKNWKIRTKDFDFSSDSGYVWLYDLSAYGSGNLDIDYYVDGSGTAAGPTVSTVDGVRRATVASGDKKSHSIALEIASAATSDTLDNVTIQFRPPVIQE